MFRRIIVSRSLLVIFGLGLVVAEMPTAFASHIDWDARRAEREAAREERRIEREEERTARSEPQCTCSARLSPAKPSLQFGSSGLTFIPRVDVAISLRGDSEGPTHSIGVRYAGSTAYQSSDVTVPDGVSFSGEKMLLANASCEGRWNLEGVELTRVTLPGITSSLVGDDEQLNGTVRLHTEVLGCSVEEENRQFSFRLGEFGNLKVGGWRSVR